MKLKRMLLHLLIMLLVVFGLSACGKDTPSYNATIIIKENSTPLAGVKAFYSGPSIEDGTAGPTTNNGKIELANLKGTVEVSFAKEDYSFEPEIIEIKKTGTYNVVATNNAPTEQVPTPVITLSKEEAENREEGISFSLTQETGVNYYYYSLDGTAPDDNSTKYENPVTLTPPDTDEEATITIKVLGIKTGYLDSEIAEKTVNYQALTTTDWNEHYNDLEGTALHTIHSTLEVAQGAPTAPSIFTFSENTRITGIFTYHLLAQEDDWKNQTISLEDEQGNSFGPWQVFAGSEQEEKINVYWYAFPTDLVVPAGTYTVLDSHLTSWSHNAETGGRGMCIIKGTLLPPTEQVPTPVISLSKEEAENREEGVSFSLTQETGVNYYYSLDGTEPDNNSTKYENPVTLTPPDTDEEATITIKVLGIKAGYLDSEIAEKVLTYQAKETTNWNEYYNNLQGEELFKIHSTGGVVSGFPSAPSVFTFTETASIAAIFTYHWNARENDWKNQNLVLEDDKGNSYGPWPFVAGNGHQDKENVNWYVFPDTTIPPGTYTIVDSHPQSWSFNHDTGGRGMCIVKGTFLPPTEQVPTPVITLSKEEAENREEGVSFSLTQETGVSYYYSLDGTEPDDNSTKYENPVTLTPPDTDEETTVTIKIIGAKEGYLDSEIAEAIITYSAKKESKWDVIFDEFEDDILFQNFNENPVDSGAPEKPSIFKVTERCHITAILTYHYNANDDDWIYKTINIKDESDGCTWGPWLVLGAGHAQDGKENVRWYCFPEENSIVALDPGTYSIIGGHEESWSHNNSSDNQGMYIIKGYLGDKEDTAPLPQITLSKEEGENREQGITFSIEEKADVTYRYTLNGDYPEFHSEKYRGPVTLIPPDTDNETSITIKVIAIQKDHYNSNMVEKTITFKAKK